VTLLAQKVGIMGEGGLADEKKVTADKCINVLPEKSIQNSIKLSPSFITPTFWAEKRATFPRLFEHSHEKVTHTKTFLGIIR